MIEGKNLYTFQRTTLLLLMIHLSKILKKMIPYLISKKEFQIFKGCKIRKNAQNRLTLPIQKTQNGVKNAKPSKKRCKHVRKSIKLKMIHKWPKKNKKDKLKFYHLKSQHKLKTKTWHSALIAHENSKTQPQRDISLSVQPWSTSPNLHQPKTTWKRHS